eukprot:1142300-Pelagomonas_calceolata.AAC.2
MSIQHIMTQVDLNQDGKVCSWAACTWDVLKQQKDHGLSGPQTRSCFHSSQLIGGMEGAPFVQERRAAVMPNRRRTQG